MKALITGITGQDGSYLAELLLSKGYEVHGVVRRASTFNTHRLEHLIQGKTELSGKLILHYGELSDGSRLSFLLRDIQPDEVYNLAAQSHVRVSFDEPVFTGDITALGTVRLLDAIRETGIQPRFYQASSSEMFGSTAPPQRESTSFAPRSPYGVSKLYSHWITRNYREAHGMFAVSGILFNHESPRRGPTFVTRKISRAVAAISRGELDELVLGNLEAVRDWGYSPDYVVAMWRMLQQSEPRDFVIGTGQAITVRDFAEQAFAFAGLDYKNYVTFSDRYLRPTEVDSLIADPSEARKYLDWKNFVGVRELAAEMVRYDLENPDGKSADKPMGDLWKSETEQA